MSSSPIFDYIVIGGGIAGSTFANLKSQAGFKVLVIEKDAYPKHKVCGEYVSMESYDFMKRMGVPLDSMNLPRIDSFTLSNTKGKTFNTLLDLGGFGISRFSMDNALMQASKKSGATWVLDAVLNFTKQKEVYEVKTKNNTYLAKELVGAWGKRSSLDRSLDRPFYFNQKSRLTNWVGIKYHIKTERPANAIALHTFKNGYCGISKIEDETYCLCYLMRGENLQNKSIKEVEEEYLYKNPFLKEIFTQSKFLYDKPLAISQINFQKKSKRIEDVLMLGDTAGLIAPLCGNGMSMAMHSALLASEGTKSNYQKEWKKNFKERMMLGRTVQYIFGSTQLMNGFVAFARAFPPIAKWMIKKSHGKPF